MNTTAGRKLSTVRSSILRAFLAGMAIADIARDVEQTPTNVEHQLRRDLLAHLNARRKT